MKCPFCGFQEDRVIDSRPTDEGATIRRRRECSSCLKRFTTYEKVEMLPLMVIKKDHTREAFDRQKLLSGIIKACEKRPVSTDSIERLIDEIEGRLSNSLEREVDAAAIGQLAMDKLREIDQVSYVRFASVYREFKDVACFLNELQELQKGPEDG